MTLEIGPYDFDANSRTGRVEVYRTQEKGTRPILVGSMPGDPSDDEIREMIKKLQADPQRKGLG